MAFVPWPGFGPFESWDPEHTVEGGETLELAGLTIDVRLHARPQPRPRDLRGPRRARAVLRRRAVPGLGRPHRPARRRLADAAAPRSPRCSTRFDDDTVVYPGHMGITTLGAERATNPFLRRAVAAVSQQDPGAARHVRRAARAGRGRARGARGDRAARARGRRLPAHRDADVRAHRAVRARRRRVDRHRPEGDVHLRRRRRALAHAAPRGHRAGLPRLRRARHAQAAPAGEALVPVELLPQGEAAGRPLPPVLAGRRRGDRLRRPGRRRRDDRAAARRCSTSSASRGVRLRLGSLGTLADARRLPRASCRPTCARTRTSCPTRSARASTSTRCARSTPTTRARATVMAARAAAARRARRRRRRALRRGARAARRAPSVAYEVDPTLVRGLDYYTRTVFEFTSDALGAQSGVGGGGRYDGLVEQLGGPPTPGCGWAAGVERILLAGPEPAGRGAARRPLRRVRRRRRSARRRSRSPPRRRDARMNAQMELAGRSRKGQLKQADRLGARYVAIVERRGNSLEGHAVRRAARTCRRTRSSRGSCASGACR